MVMLVLFVPVEVVVVVRGGSRLKGTDLTVAVVVVSVVVVGVIGA